MSTTYDVASTDHDYHAEGRHSTLVLSPAAYTGCSPGWYQDETDPDVARYWDGHSLGEERRPVVAHHREEQPGTYESSSDPDGRPSQGDGLRVSLPPAGWYRDRDDQSVGRYWDGSNWTELRRPITPLRRSPRAAHRSRPALVRRVEQRSSWVVVCLAVLTVVGVLLAELGKPASSNVRDSTATTQTPRTAAAAPTTTFAPTTTMAPTTTVAPTIPVAPQPTADKAGIALVANWAAGNRTVALSVATVAAVDTLFAISYPRGLANDRGCSDGTPPVTCTFGPPGGANPNDPIYSLTVQQVPAGWYVSSVTVQGP